MRSWLAIVLLTLLPLQFSWAAVASYCRHDGDLAPAHFGHHEHEHHATTGAMTDAGAPVDQAMGIQALDADCGHCHGLCVGLPMLASPAPPVVAVSSPSAAGEVTGRTLAPPPPERPQWPTLA